MIFPSGKDVGEGKSGAKIRIIQKAAGTVETAPPATAAPAAEEEEEEEEEEATCNPI